ncbi:MAG: hypothetical protein ACRC41_11420 [Sarcina sp.]
MTFTINFNEFIWGLVGIVVIIAIIFLIILITHLIKVLKNINLLLAENKKNLDQTLTNVAHISENAKDISDVVTDTTADVIIAKENLTGQLDTVKDILNIILGIFKR